MREIYALQSPDGSFPGSPDDFLGGGAWLTTWHGVAPDAWVYFANAGSPLTAPEISVTVTTSPPGRTITVDGVDYSSPQTFSWVAGSQHQLGTSSPQGGDGTRYVFGSWSDGGAIVHDVTTPAIATAYVASFATQYRLTTAVSPLGAGSIAATQSSPEGFDASATTVKILTPPNSGDAFRQWTGDVSPFTNGIVPPARRNPQESADMYFNSGSSVLVTATPASGYRFADWSGDASGTTTTQTIVMSAEKSVTATFTTELLRNGDFADGLNYWTPFPPHDLSAPMARGFIRATAAVPANGVPRLHAPALLPGTTTDTGVFQESGATLPAMAPVRAQISLANTSSVARRFGVAVVAHDFSDGAFCTFWLAPGSPRQTYQMRTHTTQAWTNATIYLFVDTNAPLDESAWTAGWFFQVDDVSLQYDASGATDRTDCVDPTRPAPSGGADGSTLLTNGNFGAGLAPWVTTGSITSQIANGVFEFYRSAASPAGVVRQTTAQPMAAREILTAQFQLGNSSSVRQRVTVQVGDTDASDLWACTFWLPPGQALSAYAVRGFTKQGWANATVSVSPETVGTVPWIRLDDVTLQRTPNALIAGTECLEPGAAPLPRSP